MARRDALGNSLEFSREVKGQAFQCNWHNVPRDCVGYWCEWCYFSNPKREYFQVDHIIPASRREELGIRIDELTDISNACVLCSPCNQSKNMHDTPRHGVGLSFRAPNINFTHGSLRQEHLDWDDLVLMAQRKGKFQRSE